MFSMILQRIQTWFQCCVAVISSLWKIGLSVDEEENHRRRAVCLNQLLAKVITRLFRDEFHLYYSPDPKILYAELQKHATSIQNYKNGLYVDTLLPGPTQPKEVDSRKFDLSLLFYLYSNFCNRVPPTNGWMGVPDPIDVSREAQIVRMINVRNDFVHPYVTNEDFEDWWKTLFRAATSLGCNPIEFNAYNIRLHFLVRMANVVKFCFAITIALFAYLSERLYTFIVSKTMLSTGIKDVTMNVPMHYPRNDCMNTIIHQLENRHSKQFGVVITGPGGVGKTQMALAICEKLKPQYKHVIWVDAEGEKIKERFQSLYTQMKLHFKDRMIDIKGDQSQERDAVFNFLATGKTLMVLDNVVTFKDIKNYLPNHDHECQISILITSQTQEWNEAEFSTYKLNVFNQDEAVEFMKKNWKHCSKNIDEDTLVSLVVKRLDCLPLALMQSLSFLNNHGDYDLEAYIEEFDQNNEDTLDDISNMTHYEKTVYTTSKTSVQKLEAKHIGLFKLLSLMYNMSIKNKILRYMKDINRTNIPEDVKVIATAGRSAVDQGFATLKKYSLINLKATTSDSLEYSMHSLTQIAVRKGSFFETTDLDEYAKVLLLILNKAIEAETKTVNNEHFEYGNDWVWHLKEVLTIHNANTNVIKQFTTTEKESELRQAILNKGYYKPCYELFNIIHPHVEDKLRSIKVQTTMSYALLKMGKYKDAEISYDKVLKAYDGFVQKPIVDESGYEIVSINQDQSKVDAEYWIAHCLMKQEAYREAIPKLEEVSDKLKDMYSERSRPYLLAQHDIAYSKFKSANYSEALKLFETIEQLQSEVCGEYDRSTLLTAHSKGHCLLELGRFEESKESLQNTLEKKTKAFGEKHHETLITHHTLGLCLMRLKQLDEAMEILEKVFKLKKEALGVKNPSTLTTQHRLANCTMETAKTKQEFEKALELFEELLTVREEVLGKTKERTLMTKNDVGVCKMKMDDIDGAIKIFQEVDEIQTKLFTNKKLNTFTTKYYLALCYIEKKLYEDAKRLLVVVENAQLEHFGEEHKKLEETREKIIECDQCLLQMHDDKENRDENESKKEK